MAAAAAPDLIDLEQPLRRDLNDRILYAPPDRPPKEEKKEAPGDRCFKRLLSAAATLFAVCTICINLADVTTDVVVAIQFYRAGHTLWAWLVLASLCIAHVVYTAFGAIALGERRMPLRGWPWVCRYVIILPFAQLMPLALWVFSTRKEGGCKGCSRWWARKMCCCKSGARCCRWAGGKQRETSVDLDDGSAYARIGPEGESDSTSSSDDTSPSDDDDGGMAGLGRSTSDRADDAFVRQHSSDLADDAGAGDDARSRAVRDEWEAARRARIMQRRMEKAMRAHFRRYGLFYVESGIEAAPQAVIQLVAISFLGSPSTAQLASLAMSLFSIVSEAMIFSHSFDVRVMAGKFCLAAHDVFSTFYLFSTLLSADRPQQVSFLGLIDLSWLAWLWVWKTIVVDGAIICSGFVAFAHFIVQESPWKAKKLAAICGLVFLGVIAVAPLALAVECGKLSWLVLQLNFAQPDGEFPLHQVAFRFLYGGSGTGCGSSARSLLPWACAGDAAGAPEFQRRLRHILTNFLTSHDAAKTTKTGPHGRGALRSRADDEIYGISYWGLRRELGMMQGAQEDYDTDSPARPEPDIDTDGDEDVGCCHTCCVRCFQKGPEAKAGESGDAFYHRFALWEEAERRRKNRQQGLAVADGTPTTAPRPLDLHRLAPLLNPYWSPGLAHPIDIWRGIHQPGADNRCSQSSIFLAIYNSGSLYFVGQLFSLAYPFVNYALEYRHHNWLQHACFIAAAVTLLVVVVTGPTMQRYLQYVECLRYFVSNQRNGLQTFAAWMASYHRPDAAAMVVAAIPVRVLPAELSALAAAHMPTAGRFAVRGLDSLSVEEAAAARRNLHRLGLSATPHGGGHAPS